ncbi:MAG: hypothetical protein K1W22_11195 [Lachnospiraceae bacterium]
MKGKKLLSMLTAGTLAATMVMPVMAADGGEVEVDVTTKTGVLRVEVPTTLAIAVDQFETSDVGTQIYSEEFTIANKSEINVKVGVTSTATVKNDVALAAKRSDVGTATAVGGTAWLAVAAKKSASNYEANSGADNFANLNESAANVTTFAKNGTSTSAAQTFYLKEGTGSATYSLLKPTADGKDNDKSYAQFYKLTALTTQPADQPALQAEVDKGDVYSIVTANAGNDGEPVEKIEKGTQLGTPNHAWAATNTYYTIADAATSKADLKAADSYVYGEMAKAASGADAAFRYVGALSSNKEAWGSEDISKVNIAYTIQGLAQSDYDAAVADGITYGLYKEKQKAVYSEISGAYWLSLDGSKGFAAAPTSLTIAGTASTDYTFEKSGWIKLNAKPAASTAIEFIINGTTYKVTTPAA